VLVRELVSIDKTCKDGTGVLTEREASMASVRPVPRVLHSQEPRLACSPYAPAAQFWSSWRRRYCSHWHEHAGTTVVTLANTGPLSWCSRAEFVVLSRRVYSFHR
jgi:hypothetical protein